MQALKDSLEAALPDPSTLPSELNFVVALDDSYDQAKEGVHPFETTAALVVAETAKFLPSLPDGWRPSKAFLTAKAKRGRREGRALISWLGSLFARE